MFTVIKKSTDKQQLILKYLEVKITLIQSSPEYFGIVKCKSPNFGTIQKRSKNMTQQNYK